MVVLTKFCKYLKKKEIEREREYCLIIYCNIRIICCTCICLETGLSWKPTSPTSSTQWEFPLYRPSLCSPTALTQMPPAWGESTIAKFSQLICLNSCVNLERCSQWKVYISQICITKSMLYGQMEWNIIYVVLHSKWL